jgi:hypothetical protein
VKFSAFKQFFFRDEIPSVKQKHVFIGGSAAQFFFPKV